MRTYIVHRHDNADQPVKRWIVPPRVDPKTLLLRMIHQATVIEAGDSFEVEVR